MFRLLDNNDEMWTRHAESSIVQRRYWASQLMVDITNLKQKIKVLQDDILVCDCGRLAVRSRPTFF